VPVARTELFPASAPAALDAVELDPFLFAECHTLVVENGRLRPELSRLGALPRGVVVAGLAEARARHPELVEPWLGKLARFDEQPFVALNTAQHADGAFVWIPKGVRVEQPIHLLLVGRPEERAIAFFPRNLIVAGESSEATVVEQFVTVGEGRYLTVPVTEVALAANAVVDHYKLQRESTEAYHLASLHVRQDRDSNFSSHSISWGADLARNDVHANLAGEGCEATLNGLYMVEGTQLIDHHMRVEHAAPHCDSHELYKGILEGRSRAVFNGRIFVHKGAQKTDAKQTNRNLLLSKQAVCNSNPQLEIFADDVKCTHGSTVGQLDETAVFYLRSRGIGEEAAKSLLTFAFAVDIVERVRVPAVRRELEEFLFRRLPRGEVVRQAV
jgi:Fe-S cluster assembly protein SufD